MSTDLIWQTASTGYEQTVKIGEQLGGQLKGGEIIEMVGDVGSGKTAMVRGLALGIGSTDKVASPSFTISREYGAGRKTLYHFDFYRLTEPGLIANELAEIEHDDQAIIVIEWADIVEDVLPAEHITVQFTSNGVDSRQIIVSCPVAFKYVLGDA